MKNYKEYTISSEPFNVDLLSGILWELEILGLNEFDNFLTIFVYEDSDITQDIIKEKLKSLVVEKLIDSYLITEKTLESKNWNEEYEKNINVIEVSDKIIIRPTFKSYESKENQIEVLIDPKMSFGTGEHQTTKLMLQLLEENIKIGNTVLDVGSGTAVLGITASKLGASKVIAVDNDEWCYINGKENVEKNSVNNVEVLLGTINDVNESDFDLILANINTHILIEIKQELYNKLNSSGLLILSGILHTDLEEIKRQFAQIGLTALFHRQQDEWIGIILNKA
ncbi:MAG: 50S ribosomal protein L11 methyltransferase [Ignavibacteriae bacterium]|nr:50S ribosomal protein L11 methyltransferase [Ignavibacteriota bacterium]MCB9209317.1 50S ribosomal protein L11 methyltransferase [Ignavibacteriales bacterium]